MTVRISFPSVQLKFLVFTTLTKISGIEFCYVRKLLITLCDLEWEERSEVLFRKIIYQRHWHLVKLSDLKRIWWTLQTFWTPQWCIHNLILQLSRDLTLMFVFLRFQVEEKKRSGGKEEKEHKKRRKKAGWGTEKCSPSSKLSKRLFYIFFFPSSLWEGGMQARQELLDLK